MTTNTNMQPNQGKNIHDPKREPVEKMDSDKRHPDKKMGDELEKDTIVAKSTEKETSKTTPPQGEKSRS